MDEINNSLKETLKNLANAIRFARFGSESGELINPQDFGVEIFSIADKYLSSGMIDNSGAGLNGITKLEFDGKLIQSIDSDAFKGMKSVTEITFLNGENEDEKIRSIAKNAFFDCTGLTSLYIPDSVNFIGQNAFCGCSNNLNEIHVDVNNPYYYSSDVNGNQLNAIIETSSGTLITGCSNTIFSENLNKIGDYSFQGNQKLTSVIIPDGVITIGDYAFEQCINLEEITIPNSVENINTYALASCRKLSTLILPKNLKTIGSMAFWFNLNLSSVIFPKGGVINHTGYMGFRGCSNLKYIFIPKSIITLSIATFQDSGLSSITFEEDSNLTTISNTAFSGCTSLTTITLPDKLKTIGSNSFENCKGLDLINIPETLTSIGSNAFNGCVGLKAVHINNITSWCNITFSNESSNPLYHASNLYLDGELIVTLQIPEEITEIKKYSFYNCNSLNRVTFSSGINSIKDRAFENCLNIKTFDFSNYIGESIPTLGTNVFKGLQDTGWEIIVPQALYDSWILETNWSELGPLGTHRIVKSTS